MCELGENRYKISANIAVQYMRGREMRLETRGEFRPRQIRQMPRAVDLKGRLLSCQSY